MKRRFMFILALLLACTACARTPGPPATTNTGGERVVIEAATPEETQAGRAAYEGFAAKLLAQALRGAGENPVLSPASAYFALAMTANGAAGETEAAFNKVLGLTTAARNRVCLALLEGLEQAGGGGKTALANSIWVNEGLRVQAPFLETLQQAYGAEMFQRALAGEAAQQAMNGWVKGETKGMIPKLLEEPLEGDELVMVLLNALYLSAKWEYPLDQNTRQGSFQLADGGETQADFMSGNPQTLAYIDYQGAKGTLLPYEGGRLAFLALLPAPGQSARELAASLAQTPLSEYLAAAQARTVQVSLPKFSVEYGTVSLKDALSAMGLGIAFDNLQAQFPAMVAAQGPEELQTVYISDVLQKTRVDVHELGTEAAAATAVVMRADGAALELEFLDFDRPFLYAILDTETGLPLFMGLMERP